MKRIELLNKFIEKNKDRFGNTKSLYEDFRMLSALLNNESGKVDKLTEVFNEMNMGDIFVRCPDCGSPVLLEYGNCNFCDAELMSQEKEEKKAPAKKASKKKAKVVEPDEVLDAEEEIEEVEEKPKKKAKPAKAVEVAEEIPVGDDDSDDDFPTEDEVNEMKLADLKALVKKEGLEVDAKECGRSVKKWRDAVNNAIDDLLGDDEIDDEEGVDFDDIDDPEDIEETEDEEIEEDEDGEEFEDDDEDYEDEEESEEDESEDDDDDDDFDLDGLDFDDIDDLDD